MTVTFYTAILPLTAVLVASLYLSKLAIELQERLLSKLQRLTVLERRRVATRDTIRALEAIDDNSELMKALYLALKTDLQSLRELDPERPGLDLEISRAVAKAPAAAAGQNKGRLEKQTSLESVREVSIIGGFINEALNILRRLKHFQKISESQFETARNRLRYLSVLISVNSSIRMAQLAIEGNDSDKALSCYRRAESVLQMNVLSAREKADKLAFIEAQKKRLYEKSSDQRGLLLL